MGNELLRIGEFARHDTGESRFCIPNAEEDRRGNPLRLNPGRDGTLPSALRLVHLICSGIINRGEAEESIRRGSASANPMISGLFRDPAPEKSAAGLIP